MLYLGANPENPEEQFPISEKERSVHCYVVGASGVGKSKMLLDWILQDILAGRGCAVIDPKGDLIFDILAALSEIDEGWWTGLAERMLLIDPSDADTTLAFNPLEVTHGTAPGRQKQEVFSIFRRIWMLDDLRAPRMDLVLRRTLDLLMDRDLTLLEMPQVLSDADFRERLLQSSSNRVLQNFWLNEFPQSESARFQWVSGIITRIESFLDDAAIRQMFGRRRSQVDFRKAMDRGMVLLVNLAKGRLGEETSHLLGGFLMAKLQLAAESRQNISPAERRRRFYIYVDEFQNYQTSSFHDMLAEARGYGVSLVMAHQNLAQLDVRLREAILSNAKIRACFRVSYEDAEILAKELFRITGDRVKERELAWIKIGRVPIPIGFNYKYFSPSEEARQNRETLHCLPDRHVWAHLADTNTLIHLRTVDIPPVDRRVAEERIGRLKATMRHLRPIGPLRSAQFSLPRLELPNLRGLYEWSPPSGRRRLPRLGPGR